MSGAKEPPREISADSSPTAPSPALSAAQILVDQLVAGFREQLRRALELELRDEDGPTALAFVDHYLTLLPADEETREPIISLVAAGAGAWFGELIRREIGAMWIGEGSDPRRLRLLLEPEFVHLSPVDLAYEAIFVGSPTPGDPRIPPGAALDGGYHLRKRTPDQRRSQDPSQDDRPSQAQDLPDHQWVADRLGEAAPVPEDQFYSLTGRFETLELILELLATRNLARGREPTRYHLNDYVAALTS